MITDKQGKRGICRRTPDSFIQNPRPAYITPPYLTHELDNGLTILYARCAYLRTDSPLLRKLLLVLTAIHLTHSQTTKARAAILTLPHGPVHLPLFMPVATQASLKGLAPEQLEETGCRLCLNNTYHLGLKPGQEVLNAVGGAHKLQGWKHNILTDSGGYVIYEPS